MSATAAPSPARIEWVDRQPTVSVDEREYRRLLGFPADYSPNARVLELSDWAHARYRDEGRPWLYLREAQLELRASPHLVIDGQAFESELLHRHLAQHGATRVMLLAASAGPEAEERARRHWEDEKPDEYFFLEVFGSAVVEHLVTTLSGRLCAHAALAELVAVPHYSPGYTGWPIEDQTRLFSLLTRHGALSLPGPLDVLASGMLRPKKSLLAVVGLAPRTSPQVALALATPCHRCALAACTYRRARYRHAAVVSTPAATPPGAAPAPAPHYRVARRALEKWARERVRLEPRGDGTVDAWFRFDGTTCSNQGRPLAFDYHVTVDAANPGHTILHAGCAPVPGEEGHRAMCAFLSDGPRLLQTINRPPPLLGRALSDVLQWERPDAPSGCYCQSDSRQHKWGTALEVIHFALTTPPPAAQPASTP